MDKKIIVLLLVIGLVAVVGCANQSQTKITSKPFISGTNAITFNFIEGSPPAEVYDGGSYPFEVTLNMENKGEYDVPKDKISINLVGFYPLDFNNPNISKHPEEDLKKE